MSQYGDQATYNQSVLSVLSHLTHALDLFALGRSPNIMTDIKAARASLAIMERLTDPKRGAAVDRAERVASNTSDRHENEAPP